VQDGHRESEQSWMSMLLDLKARGLGDSGGTSGEASGGTSGGDPKLAIADGALGFWAAMRGGKEPCKRISLYDHRGSVTTPPHSS